MGRNVQSFQRCLHLLWRKVSQHTQETWLIGYRVWCQNNTKLITFSLSLNQSLRGNGRRRFLGFSRENENENEKVLFLWRRPQKDKYTNITISCNKVQYHPKPITTFCFVLFCFSLFIKICFIFYVTQLYVFFSTYQFNSPNCRIVLTININKVLKSLIMIMFGFMD